MPGSSFPFLPISSSLFRPLFTVFAYPCRTCLKLAILFFLVVGIGPLWPREFHPAVLDFHTVLAEVLAHLMPLHHLLDAGLMLTMFISCLYETY